VVRVGPLFPLNSLMHHGIIYARKAQGLNTDPGNDFADEVRSYFASGTGLQEMHVSPDLLSEQNWDDLAAAAKWARTNAAVLRDSHWIGGDPARGAGVAGRRTGELDGGAGVCHYRQIRAALARRASRCTDAAAVRSASVESRGRTRAIDRSPA
jgi:hypothetical protein